MSIAAETTGESTARTPAAETLGAVLAPRERPPRPSALSTSLAFGWRAVLRIKHVPEQLFDVTAFPLMMTPTFTYLFGGALAGSPGAYLQFFLPGIMAQSILIITMYTGVAVNMDIGKGVFDRFRSLPIWRPSPMVGYLLGDAFRYTVASTVIVVAGMVLGYRPEGGAGGVLAGIAVLVAFSFAFSWAWTMFGLLLRSEKSVMSISMLFLFPLTFLSNVFVDPATMPGWLQAFVQVNPVTHVVGALRSLMGGAPDASALTLTLIDGAAFLLVFGTLTMRLYNRK